MMTQGFCPKHGSYEYYMHRNIVPPCPVCGWGKYGDAPLTSEEYHHAMGVKTN